jgi:hypothetical protein
MSEEHTEIIESNGIDTTPAAEQQPIQGWQDWVNGLDRLNDTITRQVADKLDGLTNVVRNATENPPPEPLAPPNFEEMTNSELASHMLGTVSDMVEQAINKAMAPIMDQFGNLQRTVATNAVGQEMKELMTAHKDFKDWKGEMMELATQHPSLGFRDVYLLARSQSPAKAGELDRKYNPPAPKPRPFGGLTPAMSGKGAPAPVSAEQAARDAYNEVMARHPNILPVLQDL